MSELPPAEGIVHPPTEAIVHPAETAVHPAEIPDHVTARLDRLETIVGELSTVVAEAQTGGVVSLVTRMTVLEGVVKTLPTAEKLTERHNALTTLYNFAGRFWRLPPFPKD